VPILHAIVLGIAQGLAEFLPISSSGHLIVVPWLFGWNDFAGSASLEKAFDTALHIGTLVAVVAYFWKDLWELVVALLRSLRKRAIDDLQEKLAWLLVLSAIPGAITGALLDNVITEHLGQPWLIGLMLVLFGLVLLVVDRWPGTRTDADFAPRDALLMGAAQALALQPGVSRSGATITMARGVKFGRDAAARLSFLMAVPITFGAALYKMLKLQVNGGIPPGFGTPFLVGVVVSGAVGWVAIAGLLRYVRTRSFTPFVIYRVVVGVGIMALAASSFR
jgi:undecaprenyl-diphosphatase